MRLPPWCAACRAACLLVGPSLRLAVQAQLASCLDSTRLAAEAAGAAKKQRKEAKRAAAVAAAAAAQHRSHGQAAAREEQQSQHQQQREEESPFGPSNHEWTMASAAKSSTAAKQPAIAGRSSNRSSSSSSEEKSSSISTAAATSSSKGTRTNSTFDSKCMSCWRNPSTGTFDQKAGASVLHSPVPSTVYDCTHPVPMFVCGQRERTSRHRLPTKERRRQLGELGNS